MREGGRERERMREGDRQTQRERERRRGGTSVSGFRHCT